MTEFATYLKQFDGDLQRLRGMMHDNLGSKVALIAEMEEGHYLTGGKRLRAIVTLLAARLCGAAQAQGDAVAVAIEFIHTATLLHDDVVDEAPMRRHQPAASRVYGNAAAVLAGDFLYSRASQMLAQLGNLPLLQRVADVTNQLAEGELLQLLNRGKADLDEATYYKIIESKTANLFAVAAASGALLQRGQEGQGAQDADAAPLSDYGRHLGIAFQLVDDCLDYEGEDGQLGKKIGADFSEGKMTLPIILMLAQTAAGEREALLKAWESGEGQGFADIMARLKDSGALNEVRRRAGEHIESALSALEGYPNSEEKTALIALAKSSVGREK